MNSRRRFEWRLRDRTLLLGEHTLILGVLNVTPDSFSDGGRYSDPDRAFAHAVALEEQGADILDIGAESTKPGSERVSEAEELRRLIPVLKRLKGQISIPISVDTYKSGVAEKAIEHGAEIVNDPSGLTFDAQLARTVANHNAGLILNHMRGTPESWAKLPPLGNVMGTIFDDLAATVHRAAQSGVERTRIVIDPGLGFGKRREQNIEILSRLPALLKMELPILIGPSRKAFLAQHDEASADYATAAAVTAGILNGAHIVRVHNVKDVKIAAQLADQVLAAIPEPEPPKPAQPPKKHFERQGEQRRPGLRPRLKLPTE